MKNRIGGFTITYLSLIGFLLLSVVCVQAQTLESQIDAIMNEAYKPDEPGAVVLVQKDGKVLFEKAYGMANLELGVKLQPNHVLRLGSITKQFTAVAMLMLVQEGKVNLDDDITKYLPDYPTVGRKISVVQLLNHTSGIKSYTDMESFPKIWRQDMTVNELVDHFKGQPFDFEPGEKWHYNNSAYILAGAIIEKASGMTYAEFLKKKVFEPLGMADTYYDETDRIIPRRVPGYGKAEKGYSNAPFLSMTLPYAAGSLMSTVADMGKWDEALYTDKLVKRSLLEKAWAPTALAKGQMTHYGLGWAINEYEGHRLIYHSGGIHGFVTNGIRVPDQHLYVVCLSNNSDSDPSFATYKIATTVLGKPIKKPFTIAMKDTDMSKFVGNYEISENEFRMITQEGTQLYSQRTGGTRYPIHPYDANKFYFDDADNRLIFERDKAGKVVAVSVWAPMPYGTDERALRTDKPMPAPKKEDKVEPATFDRYVGTYELMPGFDLTFRRKEDKFFTQATGQPEFEIFPSSQTKFFLKVVDAEVEFFIGPDGKVTEMMLYQGGQQLKGKRKNG